MAGLFKEFESSSSSSGDIRYFQRQFVIVPAGGGFCIRNEMILVTSATGAQARTFLKPQAPVATSVTAGSTSATAGVATNTSSLQNRLQMNQPTVNFQLRKIVYFNLITYLCSFLDFCCCFNATTRCRTTNPTGWIYEIANGSGDVCSKQYEYGME